MKILDMVGDKIVLSPEVLTIPEFKALWDRDKTTDKSKCFREVSHIAFLKDNSKDNPYRFYSEYDREAALKVDFPVTKDDKFEAALEKFTIMISTRYERVIMSAFDALEAVESYYKDITLLAKNKGEFDINELLTSIKNLGAAFKQLKDLETQLQADRLGGLKTKGDHEIGEYEL